MSIKKRYWYRTCLQTICMALCSMIIGLGSNYLRNDGVPVLKDRSIKSEMTLETGESIEISLQEARRLCLEDKALFLDAREREDFIAGHIDCAMNFPWMSFDQYFEQMMETLSSVQDKTIITYCDGENCDLSKDLAMMLIELGFKDVKVLVNGWTIWVNNDFPVHKKTGA